jgi:hypothetical protein
VKRFIFSVLLLSGMLTFASGCARKENLTLKFVPNSTSTCRVVTENGKDYEFNEVSLKKTTIQHTVSRTEMVYDQRIRDVDPCGTANAQITIKELKHLVKTPESTTVDFDSSRTVDKNKPLAALVGQSYFIKIAASGDVIAVDAKKAMESTHGDKTAQYLLSDDVIKRRHDVPGLPQKQHNITVGQSWSKLAAGPSGMLIPKSYERIYTLDDIEKEHGQRIAVISMQAKPTSAKVQGMSKEESQGLGIFAKMFDTKETYTGSMRVDLNTGAVIACTENFRSDLKAVDPENNVNPDVLTMGFFNNYMLEKIR